MNLTKKIQTIIFDMDGVIFDTERLCLDCWMDLAARMNLSGMREAMHACIGTNDTLTKKIMLDAYGENFDFETFKKEASIKMHAQIDTYGMPIKAGVEELLTYLKQQQYHIGLASSTKKATVIKQLTMAGLIDYFEVIIGGDMLQKSKPEPDIYLMACETLHILPIDAYAIEDSFNGIRSAYRAGMKPIMVPDLIQPDAEMKQLSFRIFPSLMDVTEFLKQ